MANNSTSQDHPPVASPHLRVRDDWLALHTEAVLDPGRPIIDAHHHLWDRPGARYLVPELLSDVTAGHRVVATIYVQARSAYRQQGPTELWPVGEVEFARAAARETARLGAGCRVCAGIIGFADLMLGPAVEPVLDALTEAGEGRLCGIRNTTAWHPDPVIVSNPVPPPPGLLAEPHFGQAARILGHRRLVLDVWAYHTQLDEVLALAQATPGTTIVLDHLGGPLGVGSYAGRRDEVLASWRVGLERLARCSNVRLKLGGLAMRVGGFSFHEHASPPSSDTLVAAWGDMVRTGIDLFGPERCMFESNFPVDKGMVSYVPLWNAFKKIAAVYTQAEQDALFGGTANQVYGLGLPEFSEINSVGRGAG